MTNALLPFVPVLKNGAEVPVVKQALNQLRADQQLVELEPLLAFFASVLSNPNFKVNPLARSRRFSAEALTTNPNF